MNPTKKPFSYATVCSGVEGCSLALNAAPPTRGAWEPVFFAEIAAFPAAVLQHYYPQVPNLGDLSKIRCKDGVITNGTTNIRLYDRLDLLAGGTPCQDFSLAGKRGGAAEGSGTRSSLCWDFVRLVSEIRPRAVLWENVAGALSTHNGADFQAFVNALQGLGYSVAWRILDAQYTRVDVWPRAIPQRRRRIWLVALSGARGDRLEEVLFEPQSMLGDTPPSRTPGKALAGTSTENSEATGGLAVLNDQGGTRMHTSTEVAGTLRAQEHGHAPIVVEHQAFGQDAYDKFSHTDASPCLRHHGGMYGGGSEVIIAEPDHCTLHDVARTIAGDHDSRISDGSNVVLCTINGHTVGRKPENGGNSMGLGSPEVSFTLTGTDRQGVVCKEETIPFNAADVARPTNRTDLAPNTPTPTLDTKGRLSVAIGFIGGNSAQARGLGDAEEESPTIRADGKTHVAVSGYARRLTPTECEGLMGYPHNYTRIPFRGRPAAECPDTPRYQACGNGWAINCARWVLLRIHHYLLTLDRKETP